jgi:hypothetical protein
MGHANRPRLYHALGVDAQSRRVRFPSAHRRRVANSDSKPIAYIYIHAYADSDRFANPDAYRHVRGELHDVDWHRQHNRRRY